MHPASVLWDPQPGPQDAAALPPIDTDEAPVHKGPGLL
eukprot:gene44084-48760_t